MAPPVMMIGPSAPNGPPEPIEMAEDSGFNSATFGSTRLPLMRIASIASGMPWPRMRSEPYRAITPMIHGPCELEQRPRQRPASGRRQLFDGANEPRLHRIGRAAYQTAALGRQPQLQAPRVGRGGRAQDQSAVDQAGYDRRHGTLVRVGPRRERVERRTGEVGERLQHEELGAAEADGLLRRARRFVKGSDDAADRVEDGAGHGGAIGGTGN